MLTFLKNQLCVHTLIKRPPPTSSCVTSLHPWSAGAQESFSNTGSNLSGPSQAANPPPSAYKQKALCVRAPIIQGDKLYYVQRKSS